MIVFAFPPQAAQETAPYWLSGTDYATKEAAGTLIVVPAGCRVPDSADAPVFCMDEAAGAGSVVGEAVWHEHAGADVSISSRLSGGTLQDRLAQAVDSCGGRLWLKIEPLCTRFPMPCPTGAGETITQEESLKIQDSCPAFFSPELCCMYCVQMAEDSVAMHLFDTPGTVSQKLRLANALGVPYAFGDIPLDAI